VRYAFYVRVAGQVPPHADPGGLSTVTPGVESQDVPAPTPPRRASNEIRADRRPLPEATVGTWPDAV
jgi:hypothetical protein